MENVAIRFPFVADIALEVIALLLSAAADDIPYYLVIDTILNYSLLTPRRLRREIPTSTRTAFCLGKRTYTLSVGVNFRSSYGIFYVLKLMQILFLLL